ncbi:MAG: RNA polymerase subunit sigma, partial [Treponema sp.]|nr:RNA polymerase subunit sigma [Treponema sp.]
MTVIKRKKAKKTASSDENILLMYLNEISRIPLLSREEEEKTARQAAAGNKQAREKLLNANLRFVINVAKKYQGQGLPLEDLISEGNVGLVNAVDRFKVD